MTLVSVICMTLLMSCGEKDPWIGTWEPAAGGMTTEFKDDGTVIMAMEKEDGSFSISGKWKKVEGQDRTVTFKLNPSTIKAQAEDPFVEALMKDSGKILCSKKITMTISEDGTHATGDPAHPDAFVKID